jgi:hypothetical protein
LIIHSRHGTPISGVIAVRGGNCAPTGASADPSRQVIWVKLAEAPITSPTQEATNV